MELSDSFIKNFLIFVEMEFWHFQPKLKKCPEEIYYASGNGNPKKILIFSQKKAALIFREKETLKKLLIFQEVTWKAWKSKMFYNPFGHCMYKCT